MKYKVGDKVKVKSWDKMAEEYGVGEDGAIDILPAFVTNMKDYCGEVVTIDTIFEDGAGQTYLIKEDNKFWDWDERMFEEVHLSVIEEISKYSSEMKGVVYKHFKGGRYIVTDVSLHTEENIPMVIYKDFDNSNISFARPLEMFLSKVDKSRYPDVKQEYRFERVWEE